MIVCYYNSYNIATTTVGMYIDSVILILYVCSCALYVAVTGLEDTMKKL